MKRKILHVFRDFGVNNGGMAVTKRNCSSLRHIFTDNYSSYPIANKCGLIAKLKQFISLFHNLYGGITYEDVAEILRILKHGNFTHVFIDSSSMGSIIKYIKKQQPDIKIITFFHNFEYHLIEDLYTGIKRHIYLMLANKNELYACYNSDCFICLNNRDGAEIFKKYGRKCEHVIPVSLPDKFCQSKTSQIKYDLLFIGSYFGPNVSGIKWFINNILPSTNLRLCIVGSGMDALDVRSNQIEVISDAKDLSEYYNNAKVVIMPIFSGSGMKVKTAEALMFGKYIISTPEGVEGYDLTFMDVNVVSSQQEFINALQKIKALPTFSKKNRQLFLDNYSDIKTQETFNDIFNTL